ncbi:succinate dehydrogenase, hydrophobic membrane anchor protein [Alcaligenaceae bacterium CGII-47]|nr:succinate dehydrogenase, hydrophobic membrane anchor protein [Alcaligenaceae bacterium CGII-47]
MAHERIGRHRLVVGAHYGTRDFIVQRMTAVIMAVYTLVLVFYTVFGSSLDFESWRAFFIFKVGVLPVGQLLATVVFISIAWHAWVGVRDIWMDYARSDGLRMILQALTVMWLAAAVVFFAQILWSL